MEKVTTIGIDLAKNHFQLHACNHKGKRLFRKTLTPSKSIELLSNYQKCLIGMEACGSANYWARKIRDLGHTARIIPPQYVRGFVRGNHNDANDAQAICEAVRQPHMRFTPIKESHHQDFQNIHRVRERLKGNKTALSNQIRGILYEYGIRIPKGDASLLKRLCELLDHKVELSVLLKQEISELREEFLVLRDRLDAKTKMLESLARQDETCTRLMTIPGVGPIIATSIIGAVPNINDFKNGRHFAAWLGLVPGHKHTGGPNKKVVMLGITKRGDKYLRTLIIQGARAWLITAKRYETKQAIWGRKLHDKKGYNKAAVAIANKNARIIWALMKNNESYIAAKAA